MFGKIVTKLIQSLPTWEVTKYYGRVCIYQLKCLKYKVQTSEAWFNFKCKFMPGSLRNELECDEQIEKKVRTGCKKQKTQQPCEKTKSTTQYNVENNKVSARSLDDSCHDEFLSKPKKQENKKSQDNENCTMHNEYMQKKQRKVKRAH